MSDAPPAPPYGRTSLAELLPAVARSLGVPAYLDAVPLGLTPSRRTVVVLVDGLGDRLLAARGGHAPFLRQLRAAAPDGTGATSPLAAGFPSTTATSMGSLGSGRPPGTHGLLGYEVLDPDADRLVNLLSWEGIEQRRHWRVARTVLEDIAADGVRVARIGPRFFDGSGLTEAVLRGGVFLPRDKLSERVDAAVHALGAGSRTCVYLYWGDVDKIGHEHGCASWEWGQELAAVDAAVADLAQRMPGDALLLVTADHGMVDVPPTDRLDLAGEPDLAAGVRHSGGEPRALHLYCERGAAADVAACWRERLGERMWVLTRRDAVRAGMFGAVRPEVRARIGDVLALARTPVAVTDSRHQRPELLRLVGMHGSATPEETEVPLLSYRRPS